jgi:outer membrane protein
MGLPDNTDLQLKYDTTSMERDAIVDTTVGVQYDNRIEYKILQTQQRLQEANIKYYKSSFVPTISAFGNYNMSFLNNDFGKTYSNGFGVSNLGIQLTMPIFQGNKRVLQIGRQSCNTNA